jgi:hypothetical protein
MISTQREDREQQTSRALASALLKSAQTLLAKCLVELHKQAKDPSFRNDPKAGDLYTRYDALDSLVGFHESITSKCLAEAEQNLLRFPGLDTAGSDTDQDLWDIHVIETSEIELEEASAPLSDALELEFSEALQKLQLRIEYLNHSLPDKLNPRGLHPEAWFHAFQQSISGLGIKVAGKLVLCHCYQDRLRARLGDFYKKLNQALSDNGILNDEKSLNNALYVKRLEMRGSSASKKKTKTSTQPDSSRLPEIGQNSVVGTDHVSSRSESTDSHIHCSDDDRFIHLLLATESPGTGSMLSPYQRAQIIGALSLLQRSCIKEAKSPGDAEIKTSLSRILYDSGIFNASDLVQKESPAMDFVSKIFSAISEDATFSEMGKNLIFKLQIPTIKLALLDFDFFQNPAHPARRMLNLLTSLSIDVIDDKDPVLTRLQAIVHKLLNKFDTDISIFERALLEIKKLVPRASNSSLNQSARHAQQQPTSQVVRQAVDTAIQANLDADGLPGQFRIFFIEHLAPYLRVIYADQGPRSRSWVNAVKLLEKIGRTTKLNPADPRAAAVDDEALVADIEKTLTGIFPSHSELPKCLSDLRCGLARIRADGEKSINPRHSGQSPVLSVEEFCGENGRRETASTQNPASADAPPTLPAFLKPGTWFEIHQAEGKAKRLLKLSTIREQSDQVVFANRSGEPQLTIGLQAFLKDIRDGQSKPINDSNIFDRALNSVINNIRESQNRRGI